jgi:putative transposase
MYKKREFVEGAFYHVTSRTNNKIRVFENNMGRKIMLITLQDAKDRYHFRLTNFCVMPTHIHLLIQPAPNTSLDSIMHWIKYNSAKHWNYIHGSKDHLWGNRYFARAIRHQEENDFVNDYIDQNAVVVGLSQTPQDWKTSAAYYKHKGITGLVDYTQYNNQPEPKQLPAIPYIVANLIPPAQLDHIQKYIGAYAVAIDKLYTLIPQIPKIGEAKPQPKTYLHYHTSTHNYNIIEYDGTDTMTAVIRSPIQTQTNTVRLSQLKKINF